MKWARRAVVAAFLLYLAGTADAQQTIFNVPSGDISTKGDWFFQHQTVARVSSPEAKWVQTNAFGYGISNHVELDASVYNLDPARPEETVGAAGFKYVLPLGSESARIAPRVVAGDMLLIGNAQHRVGNWFYSMLGVTLSPTHTRLTGGGFHGTQSLFGRRTKGALAGIEQPLGTRWTLQADWFSGHHDLAYWIPGVVYRCTDHWMVSLGYQIPDSKAPGYRAVVLELTRF